MNVYFLILRVLHILAGIAWVGGGVASVGFITPTAQAIKLESAAFMKHLNFVRRFPFWLAGFGLVNSVTGLLLYYRLFGDRIVMSSGYSTALSLGGLAALVALGMGLGLLLPTGRKVERLFMEVAAAGGPPSPEQGAMIGQLQEKLARWAGVMTVLLLLAATAMAASEALWS